MDPGPDHGSEVYVRADRTKSQPRTPAGQLPREPLTTLVASPGDHTASSPTPLPAHRFSSITSFQSLSAPSSSPPNPDAVLTPMPRLTGTPCGHDLGGGTAVPTHQQTHWSQEGGGLPEVTQLVRAEAELESWGLLHGLRRLLGSAGFAPSQEMSVAPLPHSPDQAASCLCASTTSRGSGDSAQLPLLRTQVSFLARNLLT